MAAVLWVLLGVISESGMFSSSVLGFIVLASWFGEEVWWSVSVSVGQ